MSFVSKVLEHAGPIERKAVYEDMETLIQNQRDIQLELHRLADFKFSQFHPSLSDSKNLQQRVDDVRDSISELDKKITCEIKGHLTLSTSEFQSLTKQLAWSKTIGESFDYLVKLYNFYESSLDALNSKEYVEALYSLEKLNKILQQPIAKEDEIQICVKMKEEAIVLGEKVKQDMADMWVEIHKWNFANGEEIDSASTEDMSPSTVSLSVVESEMKGLVQGLHRTNLLSQRMKTFAKRFQKFIIPLILETGDIEVNCISSKGVKTLTISRVTEEVKGNGKTKRAKENGKTSRKTHTEDKLFIVVFERLIQILEHLHEMFLGIEFAENDDVDSIAECTLMGLLGRDSSESLLDCLQKDVLAKAIPTSAKDLAGFENVKAATLDLQEKLVTLGYISGNCETLKNSVENVNLLFSNKKCALILGQARDLMISDLLHQTVAVGDNKPQGDWPPLTSSSEKGRKPEDLCDKLLSDETFKMPSCHVSENLDLLVQLIYTTLQEATNSSSESATQLYFAVHNIIKLFTDVVPTHHRHNIENLPRMSALHHNNCMYLSHHLMTLGHQFSQALPSSESCTFVMLIPHIRENGLSFFLAQVRRQRDILLEYLEETGGFLSLEEQVHREKCERAIKQVLHQLKHLHQVWKPLLPVNLYQKVMGKLIQVVVERITDSITCVEDITQDASVVLTIMLGSLEKECAEILGIGAALLPCHIQNWSRLTNIKTVFNSSLLEIDNLWADGKGPLALTFSPQELKQMIRALFQNTDRRADLLSKIK